MYNLLVCLLIQKVRHLSCGNAWAPVLLLLFFTLQHAIVSTSAQHPSKEKQTTKDRKRHEEKASFSFVKLFMLWFSCCIARKCSIMKFGFVKVVFPLFYGFVVVVYLPLMSVNWTKKKKLWFGRNVHATRNQSGNEWINLMGNFRGLEKKKKKKKSWEYFQFKSPWIPYLLRNWEEADSSNAVEHLNQREIGFSAENWIIPKLVSYLWFFIEINRAMILLVLFLHMPVLCALNTNVEMTISNSVNGCQCDGVYAWNER